MKKIIMVVLICGILVAMYVVLRSRTNASMSQLPYSNDATAVGFHGKSQISKRMTATQKSRLEKNFLQTPALPVSNRSSNNPAIPSVINQVQTLNQFNAQQDAQQK